MISVINTEPNVTSDPFPGMSLAEACNAAELSVMEIMNEFHMGILLAEHAYLYENGVEIEYVDEAGNLNESAVDLKTKAINAAKAAGAKILDMYDAAMSKLSDMAASFIHSVAKAGFRAADVNTIINNGSAVFGGGNITAKVKCTVDPSFTDTSNLARFIKTADRINEDREDPFDKFVDFNAKSISVDADTFKAAWQYLNTNSIRTAIKSARNMANANIKDNITLIKRCDRENMNEEIANLKSAMTENAKITRSLIKVYNAFVGQMIAIVRAVMNSPAAKDLIRNGRKDSTKALKGKNNALNQGAANENPAIEAPKGVGPEDDNNKGKKFGRKKNDGPKEKKHFGNPFKKK